MADEGGGGDADLGNTDAQPAPAPPASGDDLLATLLEPLADSPSADDATLAPNVASSPFGAAVGPLLPSDVARRLVDWVGLQDTSASGDEEQGDATSSVDATTHLVEQHVLSAPRFYARLMGEITRRLAAPVVQRHATATLSRDTELDLKASVQRLEKRLHDEAAEKMVLRLKLEQVSSEYENTVKEQRHSSATMTVKADRYKKQLDEAEESNEKLRQEYRAIKQQLEVRTGELATCRTTLTQTEEEKQQVFDKLLQREEHADQLAAQVAECQTKLKEAAEKLVKSEAAMFEVQTRERTLNFKVTKLEQELALANQHREWLDREVKSRTEEFAALRSDKSATQLRLQTELDNCQASLRAAEASNRQLKENLADLTGNYEQCQLRLEQNQQHSATQQEALRQELDTQKKLIEALRKSDAQKSEKLASLHDQLALLEQSIETRVQEFNQALDARQQENNDLEARISELNGELSAAKEQLQTTDTLLQQYGISVNDVTEEQQQQHGVFSPTAAALSKLQKTGKTFTHVYADFVKSQNEVARLKADNTQLKRGMDDVLREVEARAAEYQQIEVAYDTACKEAQELAGRLRRVSDEQSQAVARVDDLRSQCRQLEEDNRWLRQANRDIADQLNSVLATIEEMEGRLPPGGTTAAANADDQSDTQAVISERLVRVRDIEDAMRKNHELLEIVRKLSDQRDKDELAESRAELDDLRAKYDDVVSKLQQLVEQRRQSELTMQSIVNEREMYRKMVQSTPTRGRSSSRLSSVAMDRSVAASPHSFIEQNNRSLIDGVTTAADNGAMMAAAHELAHTQQLLKESRDEFEAFRKETAQDTKVLQQQLQTVQKDFSECRIQLAQSKTQATFLEERAQFLNKTIDQQLAECQELRQRNANLIGSIGQFEARLERSETGKSQIHSEMNRIQQEIAHLRAEKELFRTAEARHAEDREMMLQERNRLNELIASLQSMHAELEHKEATEKRLLTDEKQKVEEELARARSQLSELSLELKAMTARRDAAIRDWQLKYDNKCAEFTQTREALVALEAQSAAAEERLNELRQQLKNREDELRLLRATPRDVAAVSTDGQAAVNTGEFEQQIARLKQDVAETKLEAERQRAHAETYQEISKSAEDKLAQNNETFAAYQEAMEQKMTELEAANANLTQRMEQLSADSASATEQLKQAADQAGQRVIELETQLQNILTAHQTAVDAEFAARSNMNVMRRDLERQSRIADDASKNYEHELIKHAKDVELLTSLKQRAFNLRNENNQLRSEQERQAETLKSATDSWNSQKALLEKQAAHAEERLADITAQNNILHSQLETLRAQIARLQTPLLDIDNDNVASVAMATDMRTIEELREVIKFLRRDKEVLEYEKEAQGQEMRRLQAEYDISTRSLNEARAQLTDLQHRQQHGRLVSAQEHEDLLAKAGQVDMLRANNQMMREENTRNVDRITYLERRVQDLSASVTPLREQLRKVQAELEVRQQEIRLLEEDNERWKNRTQQILAKYDKIDPVEHRQLVESHEQLKQETAQRIETLTQTLAEKESQLAASAEQVSTLRQSLDDVAARELTLKVLKPDLEKAKQELNEASTQNTALQQQRDELQTKLTAVNEHVVKVNKVNILWKTRALRAEESLQSSHTAGELDSLKASVVELQKQLASAREQQQSEITALSEKHAAELSAAQRSLESRYKLKENMEQKKLRRAEERCRQLEEEIVTLKQELASAQASTELSATVSTPTLPAGTTPAAIGNKRRHEDVATPPPPPSQPPPQPSAPAISPKATAASIWAPFESSVVAPLAALAPSAAATPSAAEATDQTNKRVRIQEAQVPVNDQSHDEMEEGEFPTEPEPTAAETEVADGGAMDHDGQQAEEDEQKPTEAEESAAEMDTEEAEDGEDGEYVDSTANASSVENDEEEEEEEEEDEETHPESGGEEEAGEEGEVDAGTTAGDEYNVEDGESFAEEFLSGVMAEMSAETSAPQQQTDTYTAATQDALRSADTPTPTIEEPAEETADNEEEEGQISADEGAATGTEAAAEETIVLPSSLISVPGGATVAETPAVAEEAEEGEMPNSSANSPTTPLPTTTTVIKPEISTMKPAVTRRTTAMMLKSKKAATSVTSTPKTNVTANAAATRTAPPSLRSIRVPPAPPAPPATTAPSTATTQPIIVTKTGFAIPKIVYDQPAPTAATPTPAKAAAEAGTVLQAASTPSNAAATSAATANTATGSKAKTRIKVGGGKDLGGVARSALEGLTHAATRGRGRGRGGKTRLPKSSQ